MKPFYFSKYTMIKDVLEILLKKSVFLNFKIINKGISCHRSHQCYLNSTYQFLIIIYTISFVIARLQMPPNRMVKGCDRPDDPLIGVAHYAASDQNKEASGCKRHHPVMSKSNTIDCLSLPCNPHLLSDHVELLPLVLAHLIFRPFIQFLSRI